MRNLCMFSSQGTSQKHTAIPRPTLPAIMTRRQTSKTIFKIERKLFIDLLVESPILYHVFSTKSRKTFDFVENFLRDREEFKLLTGSNNLWYKFVNELVLFNDFLILGTVR